MNLAVSETEIQQLLKESTFLQIYNFELVSLGEGEAIIRFPFQPHLTRPGGVVSGPIYMAAADLAMWLAAITRLGLEEGRMTVTAEMKTSFISVCKEDFFCKANLLKAGKRLVYGVAECKTNGGNLVAHHTLTYIRP